MSLFSRDKTRDKPRDKKRVTVEEARRRTQDADTPAVLLDVRERGEWDAGRVPGALHAPLSALASGAALSKAARKRSLVVICRSGNRSQQAVALLRARGADAVDVKGGMRKWAAAGYPVLGRSSDEGPVA
ncbi:rhodanese-like domain-containing protein [Streptomyces sp. NPDC004111]|uniref:rhodanese-like domain-containing protein n=1 Tax=Streptomyces sp. NPDC004111 TaxID=3364690 RepID=UPI003674BF72